MNAPRLDPDTLHLARARNRLRGGAGPARIAARRMMASGALIGARAHVAALPDGIVLALDDPDRGARVALLTAAAFCGDGIARTISPSARARLAHHLDAGARIFALRHRHLHPGPANAVPDPDALIGALTRAKGQAGALLQAHRPGAPPAKADQGLSHCLDLALGEMAAP